MSAGLKKTSERSTVCRQGNFAGSFQAWNDVIVVMPVVGSWSLIVSALNINDINEMLTSSIDLG